MFKLDHFVVNIDKSYQNDKEIINRIVNTGIPYEPSWGKGTKGFKVSNLWIGNEYLEMINILEANGGGWKSDWVNLYNDGHRGLICIMLDVLDINEVYDSLKKRNLEVTKPEFLKFKWFFNLFTRTMPWQNSYINFFEGIPLQIGFQQMKDDKSREFMNQYMVPNSRENGIIGMNQVIVKGPLTNNDKKIIDTIFGEYIIEMSPITIKLNSGQTLIFEDSEDYNVSIFTACSNKDFVDKKITIENVTIYNE